MRVLVVEDHGELRRMAARFLEILGHAPIEARNEAEAEEATARLGESIDVALLDVHLGPASGLALALRLQQARPGLRVLFMSGGGGEDNQPVELRSAGHHFIEKPFTVQTLDLALTELLRS